MYYFKPKNKGEFLSHVLMSLREVQKYTVYDLKSERYYIFLDDLTLLVATKKDYIWDLNIYGLNKLKE